MFQNYLFKLIQNHNLEDELFEIYPPDEESEERRKEIFREFIRKLEDTEKTPEEKVAKLIYLYSQAKELRENFKEEFPEYLSGLSVISDVIIEEINKKFLDDLDFGFGEKILKNIGIKVETVEENIDLNEVKEILKRYDITKPIYKIFVNYPYDLKEIFNTLLSAEDRIEAIDYLIENKHYKALKIIKEKIDLDELPLKKRIVFYALDDNLDKFYEKYKNEILKDEELQKEFVKRYLEFAKEKFEALLETGKFEFAYEILEQLDIKSDIDPIELAKNLKDKLSKKLYGQDHVIEKIADVVKNKLIFDENSPRYVFTFLGPSATGKTYTAKLLQEVFKDYVFKQFNMSAYEREDSGLSLIGSSFRFNHSAPGELTDFVLNHPKSIIVFDEIDKCHPQIQKQLLTIFSEGYLEDKYGWCKKYKLKNNYEEISLIFDDEEATDEESNENIEYVPYLDEDDNYRCARSERITKVSFKDTIIVFTSNAGENLYSDNKFWKIVEDDLILAESMIIEELKKEKRMVSGHTLPVIDPALISRMSSGEIVLFKELDFESIYKIAMDIFEEYNKKLLLNIGIKFESENLEEFLKVFLLRYFPILDIRRIKNKLANDIYDYVSDEIMRRNLTLRDFKKIKLNVSQKVKDEFKEFDELDIKEYFFKRNLTADLKVSYKFEKDVIYFTIEDCELKKFTSIRDVKEDLLFDIPDIKFDDIVGHNLVKDKLKEIVSFLKNAKKLKKFGVKMPKGMLLYGPPGTGKTMLAKALAAEAELPFFATNGSDIKGYYINEKGERKLLMDRIFNKAKKYAPSIVFIDEIDALGNRTQNHYEADVINKFLTHLSGFEDDNFVFVIAATNYKEKIDPAILRSGRIDMHIKIDRLDKEAREFFIKKIIKELESDIEKFNIEKLTIMTFGMSGADFEKLKTEAGMYLVTHNQKLDEKILVKFINEIKYGKEIEVEEELMKETAYHEAGHAIAMKLLLPQIQIEQATIVARENTLGFVSFNFENIIGNMTKEDIYNRIKVALAGRIAQKKKFKTIDTGATNDIEQATQLAKVYVSKFGFDEKVGNVNLEILGSPIVVDEEVKNRVIEIIKKATQETEEFVEKNWNKIEILANELLKKEIVTNKEIEEIVKNN